MSEHPDLDKYAIPNLTEDEIERFNAALAEGRADAINVLPLLRLTPLHPLDADPPIDEDVKPKATPGEPTSKVSVS